MRLARLAALVLVALTACTGASATAGKRSPSPSPSMASPSPSPSPPPSASPAGALTTTVTCLLPVTATHGLALFEVGTATPPILEVVDVSNPVKPALVCTLSPAQGGRFAGSPTHVLFWNGYMLGTADLASLSVVETGRLSAAASDGAFSPDGSRFAYRVTDPLGQVTGFIHSASGDVMLYQQPPIGGHGGPPYGPYDQLQFSADGTLLLDYLMFRPTGSVDNLQVYSADGSQVFQELGTVSGVWAPHGATLYYPVFSEGGTTGEIDSVDATGRSQPVATGLDEYYWPAMSPDGAAIVFDAYDASVPGCGGLPHLWRLDLATKRVTQVSRTVTSHPVFVRPDVVWSNEEKAAPCGPGGASAVDGVVVAHNLTTGADATVDLRGMVPGAGGFGVAESNSGNVVDTWL